MILNITILILNIIIIINIRLIMMLKCEFGAKLPPVPPRASNDAELEPRLREE